MVGPGRIAPFPVICFDLVRIFTLFKSVALLVAIQRYTQLQWTPYKDSAVLNGIYKVLAWKGAPGTVEVTQDWTKINVATDQLFEHFVMTFFTRVQEGPRAVIQYLELLERLRDDAKGFIAGTFADANQINSDIAATADDAVHRLAAIKLGSSIAVAGLSGGIGVLGSAGGILGFTAGVTRAMVVQAGFVSTGYSIAGLAVKSLTSGKDACAIAVRGGLKEAGSHISENALDQGAKYAEAQARLQVWRNLRVGRVAEEKIEELSASLARKVSHAKIAKLNRQIGKAQLQLDAAASERASAARFASAAKLAGKAIPIVFAIKDIIDAVGEYNEDVGNAARKSH